MTERKVPKSRAHTWIGMIIIVVGLPLVAVPGLWMYMSTTATRLHPNPQQIPFVSQSTPPSKWTAAVEQGRRTVLATLAEQNLPALSVAVGIGDDIVWAEGFGFADLDRHVPVTPRHRFRIGTASIVLTSAAAGLLIEQNRLKLDDVIQTYVPEYPKKQWPVTVRQLMGHLSGLRNDGGDEGPLLSKDCERPVDALESFAQSPLLFQPGTRYRDSSYGWILLSAAIEAAADQPLLRFMRQHIFDPLRMQDTIADDSAVPAPDRAISYFPRFAANPTYGLHLMRDVNYSCYAGSSAFLSTPSDLVRFGMAVHSGKLLHPDTVRLLQTPQQLSSGKQTAYGLGWDIKTVPLAGEETRMAGHDGKLLGGMVASLLTFPKYRIVVATVSNISYADTFSLGSRIAQPFAEGPPKLRQD